MIFAYNPAVDLDPELAADPSAENHHLHATAQIRPDTEQFRHQNWTFHIGNAKLRAKDRFFASSQSC